MRDRELREWRAMVRERADAEWRALSSDVIDELACHLADQYAAARRGGATDAEARDIARQVLNAASFLELSKRPRARIGGGYGHDLKVAVRQMLATPVVTIVAVLSLALGIGANTAIFSLVNSLLLRALPVKEPDRLAMLGDTSVPASDQSWTYAIWQQLHQRRARFDNAFAWSQSRFNLSERGETEFADGILASAGMFDTLGVEPVLGRGFTEADDVRGGGPDGPVAVISYPFWQRRYGGASDALGRRVTLNGVPFTVIGILPPDFFGPDVGRRIEIAIPVGTEPLMRGSRSMLDERRAWWLSVMFRLKPGQTFDEATALLRSEQPQIREAALPPSGPDDARKDFLKAAFVVAPAANGTSSLRARYQRPLMTILVVVGLVLLIACLNIANLLLARATVRRHEMSVRAALGASRWRIARQLLIESLVLSSTGAALGLLLAQWGSRLLVQQLSTRTNTVFLDLTLDWRILVFTAGVTVATALLFGIAPAFRTARVAPMEAIRELGRGMIGSRRLTLAGTLVATQVALSMVLLVAAALFVRTFANLAARPIGFDRNGVLLVHVDMRRAPEPAEQRRQIGDRIVDAVRTLPGVKSVSASALSPIGNMNWNGAFQVVGAPPQTGRQRLAYRNSIAPGWFVTYGTALVGGRDFVPDDRGGSPSVAIVNQAFARQFLNGQSPIGRTLRIENTSESPLEVVGVVEDAVYRSLRADPPPTVYTPLAQAVDDPFAQLIVSVRAASGPPALLTRSVAAAINSAHSDLALTFRPLADQVNAAMTQERVVAMLSGFFGVLALLLAALGLYGVTAYAVSQRRAEIGVRMALGAAPARVMRLVLRRVGILVLLGVLAGVGLSWWAATFVSSLLFGLEPRDPTTLAGAAVTLALIGALAGWIPAYRATRIDPAEVLREA